MTIRRQQKARKRKRTRKPTAKLSLIFLCMQNKQIKQLYDIVRGLA